MRDTFLLLWVGFLVIGVLGSIVSSARKQAQRAQTLQQPPHRIPTQWQPPAGQLPALLQQIAQQVAPPAPPAKVTQPSATPTPVVERRVPVKPKAPAPPPPDLEPLHDLVVPHHRAHRFFRSRQMIVQAVIAAEVLGKPRALRDEYL